MNSAIIVINPAIKIIDKYLGYLKVYSDEHFDKLLFKIINSKIKGTKRLVSKIGKKTYIKSVLASLKQAIN